MASSIEKTISVVTQPEITGLIQHEVRISSDLFLLQNGEVYDQTYNTSEINNQFTISKEVQGSIGTAYRISVNSTFSFKGTNVTRQIQFTHRSI